MKKRKSNDEENDNDLELPSNLRDNLSLDEKILYKSKGVKKFPLRKPFKYAIPIFFILLIVESLIGIRLIPNYFNLLLLIDIFALIMISVMWVATFKFKLFDTIIYFALTKKAVYIYQYPKKFPVSPETLEKVDLNSLTAVLFKKLKSNRNLASRGFIDFVYPQTLSSASKIYPACRRAIGEVNDVLIKCNIIESIIWRYSNVNERIKTISEELDLKNLEINPSKLEFVKLKKRVKHHNIELVIGSVVFLLCVILISLGNNLWFIYISGIITSLTLIVVIITFDIHIRPMVPSKEGTIQITSEGLKFIYDKETLAFDFNSSLEFNFNIITNKMFSENFTYIGTITIQEFDKSNFKIKFGPTTETLKILELLYLCNLSWKNQHQLLLEEREIQNLSDQRRILSSNVSMESKLDEYRKIEAPTPQVFELSEELQENIKTMLVPNEKILTLYRDRNKKRIIITFLITFSIGVILTSFSIWRLFEFNIAIEVVYVWYPFTIGMVMIIFPLIYIYEYLFIGKIYVFTNQKLILKNFKKYYDVPYKDISLVRLNNGKIFNFIQIDFKVDSKITTIANINNISLQVEKSSNLYDKIISYKKSFT